MPSLWDPKLIARYDLSGPRYTSYPMAPQFSEVFSEGDLNVTRKQFKLLDDDSGEYSIEIYPGRMSVETISVLRKIGFNRISMGIQDFDPDVQQAVNRFNSVEEISELMGAIHREGFHSVNMDF